MKHLALLLVALPALALAQPASDQAVNAASAAAAPAPATLAKPPKVIKTVPPQYPLPEQRAGHHGRVLLRVQVLVDGAVGTVGISESSGYPALDEAALAAARQWQFAPASNQAGDAVEASVQVPLTFKLDDSGTAGSAGDPKAAIQALFKQPCSTLNAEISAYRAAAPDQPLRSMSSFKTTSGVLIIAAMGGKAQDAWLRLNQQLPATFEQVALDCAATPGAVYEDVLAEALRKTAPK